MQPQPPRAMMFHAPQQQPIPMQNGQQLQGGPMMVAPHGIMMRAAGPGMGQSGAHLRSRLPSSFPHSELGHRSEVESVWLRVGTLKIFTPCTQSFILRPVGIIDGGLGPSRAVL